DAVWAAPFRILPDLDLPARVDSAVNARLAGKPVHAVLVECAGVEVGVAAVLRQLPHVDRLALRIVADDRVLPAVGNPRLAIGPEYHAMRRRALAERHLAIGPRIDVDDPERALALRGIPDFARPPRRRIVRPRAGGKLEHPCFVLRLVRRGRIGFLCLRTGAHAHERDGGGNEQAPHEPLPKPCDRVGRIALPTRRVTPARCIRPIGSSWRRSPRWTWNPSSCRGGTPSRRPCPSASGYGAGPTSWRAGPCRPAALPCGCRSCRRRAPGRCACRPPCGRGQFRCYRCP